MKTGVGVAVIRPFHYTINHLPVDNRAIHLPVAYRLRLARANKGAAPLDHLHALADTVAGVAPGIQDSCPQSIVTFPEHNSCPARQPLPGNRHACMFIPHAARHIHGAALIADLAGLPDGNQQATGSGINTGEHLPDLRHFRSRRPQYQLVLKDTDTGRRPQQGPDHRQHFLALPVFQRDHLHHGLSSRPPRTQAKTPAWATDGTAGTACNGIRS
jgi:hypothetical protein